MKKIIVSIIVLVLLLGGGVWLGVYLNNQNNTPTASVQMDLNPSAQFVVNSKNKVLSVTYLNNDANNIYANIEVEGKDINDVAREFTITAIKSGYNIDVTVDSSSDGTKNVISLHIDGSEEQAEALKQSISNAINTAFDENGVFGRAVATINAQTTELVEKYSAIAKEIGLDVKDFADKTETEILQMIRERSEQLKGVVGDKLASLEKFLNEDVIAKIKESINSAKASIDDIKKQIDSLSEQIKQLSGEVKKQAQEQLNKLKQSLNEAKSTLSDLQKSFEEKVNAEIAKLKEESKALIAKCKETINAKIEAYKEIYDAHIEAFEKDKETTIAAIKAWREAIKENHK